MKIILSESQIKLLNESLGVPESILEAAETLYDDIEKKIKTIDDKQDRYEFFGDLDFLIGDKKKVRIEEYSLTVEMEVIEDFNQEPELISMGVAGAFYFDRTILKKVNEPSGVLELTMTFAVNEYWEPYEIYESLEKNKISHVATLAHELKHKYDKQVKTQGLIGHDAEYQATMRKDNFGIPVIDNEFFRNLYFVSMIENLVRPTEVASQIKSMGITKKGFMDFLSNERVYKELTNIKNFTFENFIETLKSQMERVDFLINHIGEDPSQMTEAEKINRVLEVVYISIVNTRMELFVDMTTSSRDNLIGFGQKMGILPDFLEDEAKDLEKVNKVRDEFLKFTIRYRNNPVKFFRDEFKKFNSVASKLLKKIGKLYSFAKDDEPQVSESIMNWELHQQLMEKKFGKRKIETKIRYKV